MEYGLNQKPASQQVIRNVEPGICVQGFKSLVSDIKKTTPHISTAENKNADESFPQTFGKLSALTP